jgi:RNA 2',3'-cyclic 3'-phosphodiesterase
MRCFISVDLDPALKDMVVNLQKDLPRGVSKVAPENLHFTLKFLGDLTTKGKSEAATRLKRIADATKQFKIKVVGVGVFPNIEFIRVVWLGSESEDFVKLHNAVDQAIGTKENPKPHLTIARVQSRSTELDQFISKNKKTVIGEMTVKQIILKKSTLTAKGPVYQDLEVCDLAN